MQFLEAGFERTLKEKAKGRILLLHGFPELAYSWRKVMLPLAQAGYHVIAPDQRATVLNVKHFRPSLPLFFRSMVCLI